MSELILVRHGQSIWNLQNRFTGWYDVDLSDNGLSEAKKAGELLVKKNIRIDFAYTSYLKRANSTLKIILENMKLENIGFTKSWEFNERHYGSLTGLNKGINVDAIPNTESLKDTYDRVIPYFNINIRPKILAGKNVIIAAHGNSLRALCKLLFNISNENINKLEIPTGNPLLVKLDSDLKFISAYYLDETRAQTIIQNK